MLSQANPDQLEGQWLYPRHSLKRFQCTWCCPGCVADSPVGQCDHVTFQGLPLFFRSSVGGLGEQPFMWQFERLQLRLLAGAQVITEGRFCGRTERSRSGGTQTFCECFLTGRKFILSLQTQLCLSVSSSHSRLCENCYVTYLLTLGSAAHHRPLSHAPNSDVHTVFGESQRLVCGISRNGCIQMVPMETVGGGSDMLHRTVTVAPVLITVVSRRGTGPRHNEIKHYFFVPNNRVWSVTCH